MKIEFEINIGSYSEAEAMQRIAESFRAKVNSLRAQNKMAGLESADGIVPLFLAALTQKALENGNKILAVKSASAEAEKKHKEKMNIK